MQVKSLTIKFDPSGSPDVAGYKLYMTESGTALSYASPSFDLGGATEVDISTLPGMTTQNGTYDLGVAAVDEAGNESSMSKAEGVVLDFVAPDPPGPVVVLRG
jgi:hypothetical protein